MRYGHGMASDNPHLQELGLPTRMLDVLLAGGFERLDDLREISSGQLLRMPHVGGEGYRLLAKALGREPFTDRAKRRIQPSPPDT